MRIGTRASALALAQTRTVADALADTGHPDIEIIRLTTSGDRSDGDRSDGDRSGGDRSGVGSGGSGDGRSGSGDGRADSGDHDGGHPADKTRWVDTIEAALRSGEIDLAVHSAKDVPGELADGLTLLGSPPRADARDVLCGADSLASLPAGAGVGTGSLRRAAQLRALRDDLEVVALGGNVDTRLRRLHEGELAEGELAAIVLARAGLERLGRDTGVPLEQLVPAPGQGALALEARRGDERVREAVAGLIDPDTTACLQAERALARARGASCHTPLGAHATPAGCGCLHLRAWVGLPDGSAWIADELVGGFYDPDALGARAAERMSAAGARELLQDAEAMAASSA